MGPGPTQAQQQSSVSQPWAPATPMLQNVLNQLGGTSLTPSGNQTNAAANLVSSTSGLPNYAGAAGNTVSSLLSGGGSNQYAPMLSSSLNQLQGTMSPFTNPNNLNPMNTPGLAPALQTMNTDITNQINSQFAAAGRSDSPDAAQALSRGLSQGDAGLLLGQYNTNVGNSMNAANTLYGAGNTTAGALTGLNQTGLTNQLQGMAAAGQIPGLAMGPASAQLGAANTQAQLPYQNLGWASGILDPIAALGGQSSGTTTTQQSSNPFSTAVGAGLGGLGLLGGTGAFGASGWLGPALGNALMPAMAFV